MFKKFLITVCGSFVGSFIAILVSMFFMMMLGVAIAAGFGNIKTNIQNHSILVLDLSGAITERPTGAGKIDEVRYIFGEEPGISLQEIERALDVAMLDVQFSSLVAYWKLLRRSSTAKVWRRLRPLCAPSEKP